MRAHVGTPHVMAVVKANAYGHGAVAAARAALAGGADWLGVADLAEALQLRAAGIDAPVLAWLHDPDAVSYTHLTLPTSCSACRSRGGAEG